MCSGEPKTDIAFALSYIERWLLRNKINTTSSSQADLILPNLWLCYTGAETREEGGTHCQRALAAEGDRGAEEVRQQEEAETASGCPRQWCRSNGRTGGTEGSLPCSWVEEGWLPSEREQRSRIIAWHREWEPLSWLRTKRQFFLSLVSTHPSVSFSLASSILTPRYATAAVIGALQRRGKRAQFWDYPQACEWGGAESHGNGARPVELMMMNDSCTTHRSRVPRRSSRRIKGGAMTVRVDQAWTFICVVCGSHLWGAAAFLLCLFILLLKCFKHSPVPASFPYLRTVCHLHLTHLLTARLPTLSPAADLAEPPTIVLLKCCNFAFKMLEFRI